jgi:hypothetical protein
MKKIFNIFCLSAAAFAIASCEPKLEAPSPTKGTVDFTKYVAYGNSLTIGFADNGLYNDGMAVAYPVLISEQLKKVGGGNFVTPYFAEEQANGTGFLRLTGFSSQGTPILTMNMDKLAVTGFTAQPHPVINPSGARLADYRGSAVNNLGIPSLRVSDLMNTNYHVVNPFLHRIYSDDERAAGKSYMQKATEAAPTFFTAWLGNNDALGYAVSGGLVPLTPPGAFQASLEAFITAVTAGGAKGAIANIPDVTSIPFMTTVGPLVKQNLLSKGLPGIIISAGNDLNKDNFNFLTTSSIWSPGASGNLAYFTLSFSAHAANLGVAGYGRHLREAYNSLRAAMPTLTFETFYASTGYDTTKVFGDILNPVPHTFVLDTVETANVTEHIRLYNEAIAAIATSKNLALVDANAVLKSFRAGRVFDGITVNSNFISGGLFSLDGVHLTPRGNAITANEFIKATNAKYGSTIPLVNIGEYRGVRLP